MPRWDSWPIADLVYVSPDEDQEDVTDEMTKYDLVAIPVATRTVISWAS